MKPVLAFAGAKVLALLALALVAGCYAGRDCKPGQACWTSCADDPTGPGCVQPWEPTPIGARAPAQDGGTDAADR